jgi:hypothetical protein
VSTKFTVLPVVEPRVFSQVPLKQQPIYNPEKVFNPGNTQSPFSGFSANVNKESELRNQLFALQNCSQSVYVPKSTSDLYEYMIPQNTNVHTQPFPNLFREEKWEYFNPNTENVGGLTFYNDTRQQIRVLTKKCVD